MASRSRRNRPPIDYTSTKDASQEPAWLRAEVRGACSAAVGVLHKLPPAHTVLLWPPCTLLLTHCCPYMCGIMPFAPRPAQSRSVAAAAASSSQQHHDAWPSQSGAAAARPASSSAGGGSHAATKKHGGGGSKGSSPDHHKATSGGGQPYRHATLNGEPLALTQRLASSNNHHNHKRSHEFDAPAAHDAPAQKKHKAAAGGCCAACCEGCGRVEAAKLLLRSVPS